MSTPLTWEEVEELAESRDPDSVVFDSDQVLERVDEMGDLFEPVATLKQRLPKLP